MTVAIASFKGGVSKTTSAVHLAAFFQKRGRTLLVDGDPNRSATAWRDRGAGFPFVVMDESAAAGRTSDYDHVVIDTEARPSDDDLRVLAGGCDKLILPTTPDAMALDGLMRMAGTLRGFGNYTVLLTAIPPPPSKAGKDVRNTLVNAGWPVLRAGVRRLAAFQKAALAGCLVGEVGSDPRAALGWEDYSRVGKELLR